MAVNEAEMECPTCFHKELGGSEEPILLPRGLRVYDKDVLAERAHTTVTECVKFFETTSSRI